MVIHLFFCLYYIIFILYIFNPTCSLYFFFVLIIFILIYLFFFVLSMVILTIFVSSLLIFRIIFILPNFKLFFFYIIKHPYNGYLDGGYSNNEIIFILFVFILLIFIILFSFYSHSL